MASLTPAAELAFHPTPALSFSPVTFTVPGRHAEMQLRVSAPATGEKLPVLLLSHGHGRSNFLSSMRGYGPLVDYFAAQGFVVIQPTHENAKALAINIDGPDRQFFWRSRARDMTFILDHLDQIEAAVPTLRGRLDKAAVGVVGHSMGGHTAAMLAGMTVIDETGETVSVAEPRIGAFVMLGVPGQGDLSDFATANYPMLKGTDYATMTRDALVVNGDRDRNPNFSDRDQWRADAYHKSPGPKSLLTVFAAEHIFGGISGYDANETTDDDPARVLFVAKAIVAYLRSKLAADDAGWKELKATLASDANASGRIDCRQAGA